MLKNPYSNPKFTKRTNVKAHNDEFLKNNSDDERDDRKFADYNNHLVRETRRPIPGKSQSQQQPRPRQQSQQQSQEQFIKSINIGDTFTIHLVADGNSENIGIYQYKEEKKNKSVIFTCLNACNGGVGENRELELTLNELKNYKFEKTNVPTSPNKKSRFSRFFGLGGKNQKSKRKGKRTRTKRFRSRKNKQVGGVPNNEPANELSPVEQFVIINYPKARFNIENNKMMDREFIMGIIKEYEEIKKIINELQKKEEATVGNEELKNNLKLNIANYEKLEIVYSNLVPKLNDNTIRQTLGRELLKKN